MSVKAGRWKGLRVCDAGDGVGDAGEVGSQFWTRFGNLPVVLPKQH